jgi:hypothetical protein
MLTPTRVPSANRSAISANQPCSDSHGIVQWGLTAPSQDITIVGSRTRKPQNSSRCMTPGIGRRNSFDCTRTRGTSRPVRSGSSSKRADARPCITSRARYTARRANSPTNVSQTAANRIPEMRIPVSTL